MQCGIADFMVIAISKSPAFVTSFSPLFSVVSTLLLSNNNDNNKKYCGLLLIGHMCLREDHTFSNLFLKPEQLILWTVFVEKVSITDVLQCIKNYGKPYFNNIQVETQ